MSPAFNTWYRYRKELHSFRDVQGPLITGYKTPSTIETHNVFLFNEESPSANSSLCRLTVSVQSAVFNTIPLAALLVKEAFRTAAQLAIETVSESLQPKVEVAFDKRLPVLHVVVEALEWEMCSDVVLSIAEQVKSWSVADTIDAVESQREKDALTNEFFQSLGKSIRELQDRKNQLNSIIQDAFWYTSYDPWLPPSFILNSLKPVESGAITSLLQMMFDSLSEVLGASGVSVVAETNWDGQNAPTIRQSLDNIARDLALIWASESLDPVYSGVHLRTVEWDRHRDGGDVLVALKSSSGLTNNSLVHMMGVYQVFEPKVSTGMKDLGCSTRLALETALLVAQKAVFPQVISHASKGKDSFPHQWLNVDREKLVDDSLVQEARKLGIASAEGRIIGLEGASPYVVFHFTSSDGGHTMKTFVNFMKKAISALGQVLKTLVEVKGANGFAQWVIPELKQKSEVLLGRTTDTIPWNEVLKTFYKRHIRDRVYDFNQPWTCYKAVEVLSASQILHVWERFLADEGYETRPVWFVVGNAEDRWDNDLTPAFNPETSGKERQPFSYVSNHGSASHVQRWLILRSFRDIRKYKLNRRLLVPYGTAGSLKLRVAEESGPDPESVSQMTRDADVAGTDGVLPTLKSGENSRR